MSTNAAGIRKLVQFAKETVAWNTASTGGGQILRRVTSTLDEIKDTYKSNELRPSYQKSDVRHGTVRVAGSINGEISPGTYPLFMAAACRKDFATAGTTGAITTLSSSASSPHFADSGSGFITGGFKIGDIVQATGFTSTGAPNNSRNYIIVALTAGVMTVHDLGKTTGTVATMTAGDTVTIACVGKKTFVPITGHTDDSFTIEHWFSDTTKSELFTGCKVDTLALSCKPGSMATIAMAMKGGGMTPTSGSAFFTSPTAATSSGILAAVNGGLLLAGTESAYVTGLDISIASGLSDDPIIGSNTLQEIVRGVTEGSGTLMAKFADTTIRDYFLNETEVSLIFYMTTSSGIAADFVQICIPRIKFTDAKKTDGPKGIIQTLPFIALENVAGGSGQTSEHTTISFQDSLAA